MKSLLPILLAALAATPAQATAPDHIVRIYSYVRSNRDGSEAERIHVFRESRTRISVVKMRERCTNAAYVTAELDPERGIATRLSAGRLRPNAEREEFGTLTYDPAARRIDARLDTPNGPLIFGVAVPDPVWHLFDFDLASLTVTAQHRPDRRANFSFGLPLIWPEGGAEGPIRYLGRADLRFIRAERHNGLSALRFEADGPALGGRGGPIWFDAADGHIIEVSWGIPNHSEYRDFRLRLTGISDGGAAEWRQLLTAHFENCPPSL